MDTDKIIQDLNRRFVAPLPEFLLGQYCSWDDETVIEKGVQNVKRILADNFVRPDESQKILSQLRKKGSYTIIDIVTVRLDMKKGLL